MNHFGKSKLPMLFLIDFEMESPLIIPLNEINSEKIEYYIDGFTNSTTEKKEINKINLTKQPISFKNYEIAFNKVKQNLNFGNSYLTNLTFPTKIEIDISINDIFINSHSKYKLIFNDEFVVFSPETFVKIENNIISSFPMKGTIDAGIPNAKEILTNSFKEIAEHNTIVDLIRNDLSMVSKNVFVENFRYIEEISTNEKKLLQASSKISGQLDSNFNEHIGEIIFSLLPAGSVSGAPKKKTLEIIKEAETSKRGYYTGICGYFNGEKLDSFVMIRFIEKKNNELFYRSGGGITVNSDLHSEYNELIDKVYVPIF